MNEFRAKIGGDGRILIPVLLRRKLKIKPGEELIIKLDNNTLQLFSLKQSLQNAQKIIKHHAKNHSLVKKLKKNRKVDFSNE